MVRGVCDHRGVSGRPSVVDGCRFCFFTGVLWGLE